MQFIFYAIYIYDLFLFQLEELPQHNVHEEPEQRKKFCYCVHNSQVELNQEMGDLHEDLLVSVIENNLIWLPLKMIIDTIWVKSSVENR
jgi:hypothetical protein